MKKLLLTGLSALILAACGGGGGGSNDTPSTAATPTAPAPTPTNPTVSTGTATPSAPSQTQQSGTGNKPADNTTDATVQKSANTPQATEQKNQSAAAPSTTAQSNPTKPYTESASPNIIITPDGSKLNLSISLKGAVSGKTTDGKIIGWNNDYSFYGAWVNNSRSVQELQFSGSFTPENEVPNSGKATYYGNAVRNDSLNSDILTNAESRINVDFGRKTVSGEIIMPGLRRNITLHEGHLSGARYSGSASVLGNSGGRYQGGLFGKNAAETAGVVEFKNNPSLNTSFGGKRY